MPTGAPTRGLAEKKEAERGGEKDRRGEGSEEGDARATCGRGGGGEVEGEEVIGHPSSQEEETIVSCLADYIGCC